jgi:hypothetical protein
MHFDPFFVEIKRLNALLDNKTEYCNDLRIELNRLREENDILKIELDNYKKNSILLVSCKVSPL